MAPGGRLIMPVGPSGAQDLLRIIAKPGGLEKESLGAVSFVPLVKGL
jgi:protein-L-isoaspartate(D-aspartate) O-methyltransferase